MNEWYVYMIECEDNSLYTGVAKNIKRRLNEHYTQSPKCARYTRSHKMKALRGLWKMEDKVTAYRLEYAIKRLDRQHKDLLLQQPDTAQALLTAPAVEILVAEIEGWTE